MSRLFTPLTLRSTTFENRVWVAPMCQYSSVEGRPNDWHLVHLGALARGGAGLVMTEATAVTPEGRISPADAGIWTDDQAADYRRITDFIRSQGAVPGIQLAHAGRKASTQRPWDGNGYVPPADGGWQTVAPSPIAFGDWPAPRELTRADMSALVEQFASAARRSRVPQGGPPERCAGSAGGRLTDAADTLRRLIGDPAPHPHRNRLRVDHFR